MAINKGQPGVSGGNFSPDVLGVKTGTPIAEDIIEKPKGTFGVPSTKGWLGK